MDICIVKEQGHVHSGHYAIVVPTIDCIVLHEFNTLACAMYYPGVCTCYVHSATQLCSEGVCTVHAESIVPNFLQSKKSADYPLV